MNKNINRAFKFITVSSFSLGLYNAHNSSNARVLFQKLEEVRAKERLLSDKLQHSDYQNQIIKSNLESAKDHINEVNSFFNQIESAEKSNINKIISDNSDKIIEKLNKGNEGISKILELLNNSGNKNNFIGSSNTFNDIMSQLQEINNYFLTLTFEQGIGLTNILGCIIIGFSTVSIVMIFFGNSIIEYLKLEERYPRLKRLISLRLKFQKYYLMVDFLLIIAVLLAMIYINLLIFLY